jgi:hypothetical protein
MVLQVAKFDHVMKLKRGHISTDSTLMPSFGKKCPPHFGRRMPARLLRFETL